MPDAGRRRDLIEIARTLRPRILIERERIESARRLPEDLARDLAHAGFFRIFLPETYGGLDLAPMEAMEVFEELAQADASVACGTAILIGLLHNFRPTPHEPSTPTPTSLPQTAHAPRERQRSSPADTA
jgi:alkylation response protein AidB-like acyl-CoA dehydrogenase